RAEMIERLQRALGDARALGLELFGVRRLGVAQRALEHLLALARVVAFRCQLALGGRARGGFLLARRALLLARSLGLATRRIGEGLRRRLLFQLLLVFLEALLEGGALLALVFDRRRQRLLLDDRGVGRLLRVGARGGDLRLGLLDEFVREILQLHGE